MPVMYCPSCHKKVQSSFIRCPYCSMSFVKQSTIEPKSSQSSPNSSIFSKVKKFAIISLSVLGGLFILLIVLTINSISSSTPSSTSEEYTNQVEEPESEIYQEKDQSEIETPIRIPMSDKHEKNRYFLLSRTSEGNFERITYLRKGDEADVYGKMEINCSRKKIRKFSTEDKTSIDSINLADDDWRTPTPDWTDNDIFNFICN